MRIEVLDGDEGWPLTEPLDREVYPEEVMARVVWRDVTWEHAHRRVLVLDGAAAVCHVGVYFREATHEGAPVRVAGIGGVMTSPRSRGRGCASDAMRTAVSLMVEHGDDFGLLFCEPHNVAFYARLGWRPFGGDVFCEQPHGRVRFDVMGAMTLPVRKTVENGVIDLQGLPW
jgi:GNAT superfamily N-acetyltransferase